MAKRIMQVQAITFDVSESVAGDTLQEAAYLPDGYRPLSGSVQFGSAPTSPGLVVAGYPTTNTTGLDGWVVELRLSEGFDTESTEVVVLLYILAERDAHRYERVDIS